MASAFLAVLNAPVELVWNQAFNVGSSHENYRISDLAQIVSETVPGSTVVYAEGAGRDKRNYRVNCDKISYTLPEFKPVWTARMGALELYRAYARVGLCGDEPFLIGATLGIDAATMARASTKLKNLVGRAAVVASWFETALAYDYPDVEFIADGETRKATFVAACNIASISVGTGRPGVAAWA